MSQKLNLFLPSKSSFATHERRENFWSFPPCLRLVQNERVRRTCTLTIAYYLTTLKKVLIEKCCMLFFSFTSLDITICKIITCLTFNNNKGFFQILWLKQDNLTWQQDCLVFISEIQVIHLANLYERMLSLSLIISVDSLTSELPLHVKRQEVLEREVTAQSCTEKKPWKNSRTKKLLQVMNNSCC